MAASLRELRQRRKSVTATKKITRAMELIASSRIIRAQQTAARALPFTRELNRAVSAVAIRSDLDHPLTNEVENPKRVAVLFITSDRGMNGAYSSNVIKTVAAFRQRKGLKITLLSDESQQTLDAYGAWGTKVLYGKSMEGVLRSTFVIDVDEDGVGRIDLAQYNVRATGHVDRLRRDLGLLHL